MTELLYNGPVTMLHWHVLSTAHSRTVIIAASVLLPYYGTSDRPISFCIDSICNFVEEIKLLRRFGHEIRVIRLAFRPHLDAPGGGHCVFFSLKLVL